MSSHSNYFKDAVYHRRRRNNSDSSRSSRSSDSSDSSDSSKSSDNRENIFINNNLIVRNERKLSFSLPYHPHGPTGHTGHTGHTGTTGRTGYTGPTRSINIETPLQNISSFFMGPEGPQGPEGPEGPEGPQGPEGKPGKNSVPQKNIVLPQGPVIYITSNNVDNYNLSDNYSYYIMKNDNKNTANISGFEGGEDGKIIYMINDTENDQLFLSESKNSFSDNRLILKSSVLILKPNQTVSFIYSKNITVNNFPGQNRWLLLSKI